MAQPFSHVAMFGKPRAEGIGSVLLDIAQAVEAAGLRVLFEATICASLGADGARFRGHSLGEIGAQADVAIVLGGDGTMLGVARELAPFGIPLIGINHGRLGFITDIGREQMREVLAQMLAGRYSTDRRSMLEGEVWRSGAVSYRAVALNDVVVARGVTGGMVEFTVRVDGVTMYNQRADGLILATPTGSTAYALSASGPILHPSLAGFVLVPVAPQTLSNRPIALPDTCVIEIEITDVREASAHFDMQAFSALAPGDVVRVRRSELVTTLLHPVDYNYFAMLRQKLHWNVMPSEPHGRA